MHRTIGLFAAFAASVMLGATSWACTVFVIAADGEVLFGNSEDFIYRGAISFVPASPGQLGRVNLGFQSAFGQIDDFAQGSMNERGLAFDATVVPEVAYGGDAEKAVKQHLLDEIMETCGTVDEAVAMFAKFNCPYFWAALNNSMSMRHGGRSKPSTSAGPMSLPAMPVCTT